MSCKERDVGDRCSSQSKSFSLPFLRFCNNKCFVLAVSSVEKRINVRTRNETGKPRSEQDERREDVEEGVGKKYQEGKERARGKPIQKWRERERAGIGKRERGGWGGKREGGGRGEERERAGGEEREKCAGR